MSHLDNALGYLGRVIDDLDHDWEYGQNLATKDTLNAAENAHREFSMFIKTELAELRAEVARRRSEREWLPIETAPPKQGFYLTLRSAKSPQVREWARSAVTERLHWWDADGELLNPNQITHWQPLPPPPTEETK